MFFDWFETLKNLVEKRGKNEVEIHAILCKYSFPVQEWNVRALFYSVFQII